FAALENIEEGNDQNKQLVIVDEVQEVLQVENNSPNKEWNAGQGSRSPKKASPNGNRKGLNPAAPTFNPTFMGSEVVKHGGADNPNGRGNGEPANKEYTSQWVHRTFAGNIVTTNTSFQEVPSQNTRVENFLAKKNNTMTDEEADTGAEIVAAKEKVKWTGDKLWINQIEEDPDEGIIPDGMVAERDSDVEIGEEEQSVNGEENTSKEGDQVSKVQENSMPIDENKETNGDADQVNDEAGITMTDPNYVAANPKDVNANMGDPGGAGNGISGHEEINKDMRESATAGNKQRPKEHSTVPLEISQNKLQQHGDKSIVDGDHINEVGID
ncbi:hypothetical protein A4A49_62801, partial [Nicotiana attenuata]